MYWVSELNLRIKSVWLMNIRFIEKIWFKRMNHSWIRHQHFSHERAQTATVCVYIVHSIQCINSIVIKLFTFKFVPYTQLCSMASENIWTTFTYIYGAFCHFGTWQRYSTFAFIILKRMVIFNTFFCEWENSHLKKTALTHERFGFCPFPAIGNYQRPCTCLHVHAFTSS